MRSTGPAQKQSGGTGEDLPRAVVAPVVDEDELHPPRGLPRRAKAALDELVEVLRFVIDRHHD
jgi:hypothetical protein